MVMTCIDNCNRCITPYDVYDERFDRLVLDGQPVKVGYCEHNDFFVLGDDGPESLDCEDFWEN